VPTVDFRQSRFIALLFATVAAIACGSRGTSDAAADARADAAWPCPTEWVRYDRGGCGPAILLCAPDGGAALHACDGVDLSRAHDIALPDGGTTTSFLRLPDGGIAGPWPSPGEPGGPPSASWTPSGESDDTWSPDAGIPTCAPRWVRLPDGTCDPAIRTSCAAGSDPIPGGDCTATTEADCPAADYVDVSPESGAATVVRVRAGADPASADGSVSRPFPTIALGLAGAGAGGWVLVSDGTYGESIALRGSVHVVGRCAARVIIGGSPMGTSLGAPTLGAHGSSARLDARGLQLHGGGFGLSASDGAQVTLRDIVVDGATQYGVSATGRGTRIDARRVRITATRALDSSGGPGLAAFDGAHVVVSGAALTTNRLAAALAIGTGSRIEVSDATIRGTQANTVGAGGLGLSSQQGATIVSTRALIEDNRAIGALALNGGRLELVDSIVRATRARADGTGGVGLQADPGSIVTATRVLVTDNRDLGVSAVGDGTTVDLTDCVVRGTVPRPRGDGGFGLQSDQGATISATRVLVTDNQRAGVRAYHPRSRVEITDTVVRGTLAAPDGTAGVGIVAEAGGFLRATGSLVSLNRESGALALGDDSRLEIADTVVRGTIQRRDGTGGIGVTSRQRATFVAVRIRVAGNIQTGVAAVEGARVEISDSVVIGTRARDDGLTGTGLACQSGASCVAARLLIADNHDVGVLAMDSGSRIDLSNCVVRGTLPRAGGTGGQGLWAEAGGTIVGSRVDIDQNHGLGAGTTSDGSRLELADSVVRATLAWADGTAGLGAACMHRASMALARVLVTDSREAGIWGVYGASVALADVLVIDVARRGDGRQGIGVLVSDDARLDGARVAVVGAAGAGVAVVPRYQATDAASANVSDLFVDRVNRSNVSVAHADAAPSAYGFFVGRGASLGVARAVLSAADYGFFRSLGTLTLHDAVITRQDRAAGATNGTSATAPVTLANVLATGNTNDAVLHDVDLVEIDLPPPPEACLRPPCM